MRCRVCVQDIGDAKYCYRCGWMAGSIELKTTAIRAGRSSRAPIELEFENKFEGKPTNADVELELIIPDDSKALASFEQPGAFSNKYIIKADSSEKIKIYLNLGATAAKQLSFNIRAISDDAAPDRNSKDFYRPYLEKQYRDVTYRIPVEILEPSRLSFSSQLLIFDGGCGERVVRATNTGLQDISLSRIAIDASEYRATPSSMKIPPGASADILVELLDTGGPDAVNAMGIAYQAEDRQVDVEILLMRRKAVSLVPDIIYDKVIAIDFGTRKTVAAYINAADEINMYGGDGPMRPDVRMIPLEKGSVANYEMPSVIAYSGREILAGTEAAGSAKTAEIAYNMKMQIQNDAILFHKNGAPSVRDTREVITDFFRCVKASIDSFFGGGGDNLYIFTLPVLDGDDEQGSLFELQKRVTLDCVRRAGFCGPDEDMEYRVKTISEPEAAMCHIVNAIKNDAGWHSVNLRPDDIICVFDYGGGTLDISFGRYKLVEGMPSVDTIANVGRYSDKDCPELGRFDLGGNRLDNNLALAVCNGQTEGIVLDEPEYGPDGGLVAAKGFSPISELLQGVKWDLYVETIIKQNKEKLSEKWDEIDKIVIDSNEYSNLELSLDKQAFREVVFKDLYYAIDAMKATMKASGIEPGGLKHIFLVGGSSLIKIIKSRLETEFSPARVYNAYDFSRGEDYERVKREAIYPVVNGAALSYLTRVTDVFNFDVAISPKAFPGNPGFAIAYLRGDRLLPKPARTLSRRVAEGEWEITARLPGGRKIQLGEFAICPGDDIMSIKVSTHFSGRRLRVSYQKSRSETVELGGLDIYV